MNRVFRLSALLFILSALLSGCGYTTRSVLPEGLRKLHIPTFVNSIEITQEMTDLKRYQTYYPGMEVAITQEVIARFTSEGIKVTERAEADALLLGEVVDYRLEPLGYNDDDTVREYRVVIVMDFTFKDLRKEEIMWEAKNFVGDATYLVASSNETAGRTDAVRDLAKRIANRTVETW